MAYRNMDYFYSLALSTIGLRNWQQFEERARKRNWRVSTMQRHRLNIETLATQLQAAYLCGAQDAISEVRETGKISEL